MTVATANKAEKCAQCGLEFEEGTRVVRLPTSTVGEPGFHPLCLVVFSEATRTAVTEYAAAHQGADVDSSTPPGKAARA